MAEREPSLTDKDHDDLDRYVGRVLLAYKDGSMELQVAVGRLMSLVGAVDIRNLGEVKKIAGRRT